MKNFSRTLLIGAAYFGLTLAFAPDISAEEAPPAMAPTKRIELFNSKDFSGWTFCLRSNAEPSATFAVSNGLMHCTGQPFGYVRTEKSYRDYKLSVEWRFVKIAPRADNSGVFVHVQTPDAVWPKAIENQGQFQHQGDMILLGGATCTGHDTPQTRGITSKQPRNEKPAGEWNTYEVICRGDSVQSFVNGKLMNEVTGCSVSSGAIAIQSEGGEWELRKAFLEPLKAP
jgi:3-keto-disaccharide hydrolase